MENIDKLIELHEKKIALLKEYKESVIYEGCDYHAVELPGRRGYFLLYLISDHELKYEGTSVRMCIWLRIHKIPAAKVYGAKDIDYTDLIPMP